MKRLRRWILVMATTAGILTISETAAYAGLHQNHCEPMLGGR